VRSMKKKLKKFDNELAGGIVFYKNEGIILLLKKEHNHWEIPGGKVNNNKENIKAAALREIEEEIGAKVKIEKYVGFVDFEIKNKCYRSHVFICKANKKPKLNEPEKFYAVGIFPLEKVEKLDLAPNVKAILKLLREEEWIK